ncbi:hypothetical protein KKC1_30420, partial [Calderihabitans maritimus]
VHRGI